MQILTAGSGKPDDLPAVSVQQNLRALFKPPGPKVQTQGRVLEGLGDRRRQSVWISAGPSAQHRQRFQATGGIRTDHREVPQAMASSTGRPNPSRIGMGRPAFLPG